MSHFGIVFIMFIMGGFIALQGGVNSQLGRLLGNPIQAAIISFGVGLLTLIVTAVLLRVGSPSVNKLLSIPKILLVGGSLGACFVTASIIFIPKIGIANVLLTGLCGQVIFSLWLDYLGAFGVPKQILDLPRIAGASLVVMGVFLMNYGRSS